MQFRVLLCLLAMVSTPWLAWAQPFFLDCNCLSSQAVLVTNACQATVPDLCQFANCFGSVEDPPPVLSCTQTPAPGTLVGPGSHPINVIVEDSQGTQLSCQLVFQVIPPPAGCDFALLCASNRTVECGTPWNFDAPSWTNACIPAPGTPDPGVAVSILGTLTNGSCPTVITRTWQAIDACNATSTCSQVVTVVDTTPPVLDCQCLSNNPAVPLSVVACSNTIPDLCLLLTNCATDACGPLTCSQSPAPGTLVFPGTHPITVTVRDCASNVAACVIDFTVTAPTPFGPFTLLCASNKTIECGQAWAFDPPTPTHFCCTPPGLAGNGVTVSILGTLTNGSCPTIITRTWQAIDACNSTSTCSQTITIVDTTPPVLDCQCLSNNPAVPLSVVACSNTIPDLCLLLTNCATDACGPLTCSQSPAPGTLVFPGTHPITVTVRDCASNVASCVVHFTVTAPTPSGPFTLRCASNKTVECGQAWTFDPPTPTNFCCTPPGTSGNGVTISVLSTVTNGTCPRILTRTWRAIDACNSTSTCSQVVTILDTIPPTLDCQCLSNNPAVPLSVIACSNTIPNVCLLLVNCANDACGPLTCSQSPAPGTLVFPGTYPITVTVRDCASNLVSCVVNFTVTAPTPPGPFTLLCASNKTVECGQTWSFDPPTPTNFCCTPPGVAGNGVTVSILGTTTNGSCPRVITRTWQAVDACNSTSTCSQVVTILDTTPPVLDCQCLRTNPLIPLTVVACSNTVPDLCLAMSNCATDVCGPLTCSQSPPAGTLVFPGTHPITVTVRDCASNITSCVVNFTVTAPTPPGPFALLCASNRTVECGQAWAFDPPTPTNFCCTPPGIAGNGVTVAILDTSTNGSCPTVITRTWQAVDACNSTSTCSQVVTVIDTTPPVLNCQCLSNNPVIPLSVVACSNAIPDLCLLLTNCASDACGPLTCSQSPPAGTMVLVGTHPITVTVRDCASNSVSCVVSFHVVEPLNGCRPCSDATNVWNTGAAGGGLLAAGTPDPVFALVSAPPGGCPGPAQVLDPASLPVPPWLTNGPDSQWIGAGPTATCPEGVYHYRVCFTLPCTEGASILGRWAAADAGAIHLNGQPTANRIPSPQFPGIPLHDWFPVTLTNGFVCGTNCLDIYVTNAGPGIHPTGFRAELTQVYNDCCCPEPRPHFNLESGMAPGGGALPLGATEGRLNLACAPAGVGLSQPMTVQPHPLWVPNGPASQWIGVDPSSFGPVGVYCYRLEFNIPCPPGTPLLAALTGRWTADDTAALYLNGQPTGHTVPSAQFPNLSFDGWHPIQITNGFQPGLNTLTFLVTNAGGPTGLRLELSVASACCNCTNIPCTVAITCPPNRTNLTCAAQAVVVYPPPTATSNCGAITNLTCTPASGTSFPLGTTSVACTALDARGNAASCSFAVVVLRDPAACSNCVRIACPADIRLTNCPPGASVSYLAPVASSTCSVLTATACLPPSGATFPLGTNTVVCTATDAAGNIASCSFNINLVPAVPPVFVQCPTNLVVVTCATNAVAHYKVTATGQVGPALCSPPSGTSFPPGTNVVTCQATNACGQTATCSFLVIVHSHVSGPPAVTLTAGLPDHYAAPVEPSPPGACLLAAFSGFPAWKGFDSNAANVVFGHRFTGLPNNIARAELVVRMRPGANAGSTNDGIFIGLPACTFASFRYAATIATLPPAGGSWSPGHPGATFVFDLGQLHPALLSDLNTQQYLDVAVHDDTTVDYLQLRLWRCPPSGHGIAVPYDLLAGATVALRPALPAPGPVRPALCVFPAPPLHQGGLRFEHGAARRFSFTTLLDFTAPEGAGLDLVLPPDPRRTNDQPFLSFRNKGARGYCVKTSRLYDDEPDLQYRSTAIGTNGDLFPSFTWSAADIDTNVLLWLNRVPGVTNVPMTVTLDLETREVRLEFPDCLWTANRGRKGWDGCIYGQHRATRPERAARLILTPAPPHTPLEPMLETRLLAVGLPEMLVEDPELESLGRPWGGGSTVHLQANPARDSSESLSVITPQPGDGFHADLGSAGAFRIGFHHFENGDIPDEAWRFTLSGGPGTTPPPTLSLLLAKGPGGVHCTVDFSALAATAITVQLWSNGVLVGQGAGPGAVIPPESPLILDRWPDHLVRPDHGAPWLALTAAEPLSVSGLGGDELRFLPTLPGGSTFPETFHRLACETSGGMDGVLYGLETTPLCPEARLSLLRELAGIRLSWTDNGYRLQGAETVAGPWFDLGAESPVMLPPEHPARFFRLLCR